jgi:hypothetical protein
VGQVGINFSPGEPASFTLIERSGMEEGKIATAWAQFATERSPSMYIRMLPWSNTFVSVGQVGINFSSLVNQPVVLLVQLNVQMEEGKIATVSQFVRLKEVHQCI